MSGRWSVAGGQKTWGGCLQPPKRGGMIFLKPVPSGLTPIPPAVLLTPLVMSSLREDNNARFQANTV